MTLRVSSKHGTSIEKGHSFSLNVLNGRKFMISKVLTQAVFGHLKHVDTDAYEMLNKNYENDTFVNDLNLRLSVLNYYYEYPNFGNKLKYKSIIFKKKRYVQVWQKNENGKYLFKNRHKVKYDNRKVLTSVSNQIGVF